MRVMIKKSVADEICRYWGLPLVVRKANPHHDTRGRFTFGAGTLDVGVRVKDQYGDEHIIQRKVKTSGGNFVFIAYTKSEHEERDNLAACEVLADNLGWTCVLLPRSNLVKTADMLNASGREFWEIKTNRTGTANSVKKEMKRGSEQSENVIIRFDTEKLSAADFSYEKMKQEVVKRKKEFTKLKKIMLITGKRIELIP